MVRLDPRRIKRIKTITNNFVNPLADTRESFSTSLKLIISALTLVAGLAWNEAIRNFITSTVQPWVDSFLSQSLGDLATAVTPFIYAIVVTVIVVVLVNRLEKLEAKFHDPTETPSGKV